MYNIFLSTKVYAAKNIHGREIKYFCENTGRIFREDIKVCKMYIRELIYACTILSTFKLIELERYPIYRFKKYHCSNLLSGT